VQVLQHRVPPYAVSSNLTPVPRKGPSWRNTDIHTWSLILEGGLRITHVNICNRWSPRPCGRNLLFFGMHSKTCALEGKKNTLLFSSTLSRREHNALDNVKIIRIVGHIWNQCETLKRCVGYSCYTQRKYVMQYINIHVIICVHMVVSTCITTMGIYIYIYIYPSPPAARTHPNLSGPGCQAFGQGPTAADFEVSLHRNECAWKRAMCRYM